MRSMREEAERFDKAMLSAGRSSERVASQRMAQDLGRNERAMRSFRQETDRSNRSLGLMGNRWAMIGGAVVAALPALTRAAGVVVQLTASLVRAAGGAGVIGGGALGAFVVGIGSVMAVVKPMSSQIQEVKKRQDAYTQAVALYGAKSKQAARDAQQLNLALKQAPANTMAFLTAVKALGNEWRRATRAGQGSLLGLGTFGANRLRGAIPDLAGMVNANVAAVAGGGRSLIDRLLSRENLQNLRAISANFRAMVPDMAAVAGDFATIAIRLTRDAGPFARRAVRDFREWADHLDRVTSDTVYMDQRFRRWTTEFRSWTRFLHGTWNLLSALLGSATGGGKELQGITRHFEAWARWIRTNPVKMQTFWQESTRFARGFGSALAYTGKLIFTLSDALTPVAKALAQMVAAIGPEFLRTLREIGTLLQTVFGGIGGLGGPLTIFLRTLNNVLHVFNALTQAIPGFGAIVSGAFAIWGLVRFSRWIGTATARMFGLAQATEAVAIAQQGLGGGGFPVGRGGVPGGGGFPIGGVPGMRGGAGVGGRMTSGVSGPMFLGGRAEGSVAREGGVRQFPMETPAYGMGLSGGATRARGLGRLRRFMPSGGGLRGGVGVAGLGLLAGTTALELMGPAVPVPGGQGGRQVLGSVASGAMMGAMLGTVVPGVGNLAGLGIGAAIGGGLGLVGGLASRPRGQHPDEFAESVLRLSQGRITGEPHTAAQIAGQLHGLREYQRMLAHDQSQRALQIRGTFAQMIQARAAALPQVRASERHRDFMGAANLLPQLGQAYNIVYRQRGPQQAMDFVVRQSLARWRTLGPEGKKHLADALLVWGNEMRRRNPALSAEFEKLKSSVIGKFDTMHGHIIQVGRQIMHGTDQEWKQISANLTTPMEQARQMLSTQFTLIQQKAIGSLQAMGMSRQAASRVVGAMESGRLTTSTAAAIASGKVSYGAAMAPHASGGRIAGQGLQDSVQVGSNLVAPGELVVNRHTESRANMILGLHGTSLGQMVAREGRPHSFPTPYAHGGRAGAGTGTGGLKPAISQVMAEVLGQFPGLAVTSTTGGHHAHGSYHYRGMAVDFGGSSSLMNQAARWVGQNLGASLIEGIHNPNLSIAGGRNVDPSYWGAQTWSQHLNHIHLAAGTYAGGGARSTAVAGQGRGAGSINLSQVYPGAIGLPGVPGVMVDTSGLLVSMATTRRLNQILGGGLVPGSGAGVPAGGGGTSGTNQALAKQMMLASGWPAAEWPSLRALWMGESGFDAMARNRSSGAFGIPQALPASKMGPRGVAGDPQAQIAWGLNYIRGRYGSPSGAYNAWLSRSPHWYRYGTPGPVRFSRPTMIGVGDTEEDVTITPTRRYHAMPGAVGTPTLHVPVTIQNIVYNRRGDVRHVVANEIREAIADVVQELRSIGVSREEEAIR